MAEIIKPKIYIDTSVISYLVSELSHDLITAIRQQATRTWWEQHRSYFDLYISDSVIREAKRGNPDEVKKRLTITTLIKSLNVNDKAKALAKKFIDQKSLPKKANDDALHIAIGAINNMDCIVTWNLKHIGNINMRKKLLKICRKEGYELPIVCTPEELIGE